MASAGNSSLLTKASDQGGRSTDTSSKGDCKADAAASDHGAEKDAPTKSRQGLVEPTPQHKTVEAVKEGSVPPPQPPRGEQCEGPCTHASLSNSLERAMRPRSLSSSKVIHLEVGLVDNLADFLEEEEATLEAIQGASGVLSLYMKDKPTLRRIVCCGSPSTLNKARQLLDAKLSQTPFRVVFALNVPAVPLSHMLALYPIPRSSLDGSPSTRPQLRRFICHPPSVHPAQSSPVCPYLHPIPDEEADSPISPSSHPSTRVFNSPTAALVSPGSVGTSPFTTPLSDRHPAADYFGPLAAPETASPAGSVASVPLVGDSSLVSPITSSALPAIGSFVANRDAYIATLVDELESWTTHRNIVRVKVLIGVQGWLRRNEKVHNDEQIHVSELEQLPLPTTWPFRSPSFTTALSEASARGLLERVRASRDGFECTKETSQVSMTLLDKRRSMYYVAVSDVKGADLRGARGAATGSGTLVLQKCTTLPSMPFSLSLGPPGVFDEQGDSEGMGDATDLRFKVLADKAGTSPSDELSKAMQQATWGLDHQGVFVVNAELDQTRYDPTQTRIKWVAKERWQNGTMRATLIESRVANSTSHTWEVCLSSPALNAELFDASVNWLKRSWNRAEVARLVGELVDWTIEVVGGEPAEEGGKEGVGGEG